MRRSRRRLTFMPMPFPDGRRTQPTRSPKLWNRGSHCKWRQTVGARKRRAPAFSYESGAQTSVGAEGGIRTHTPLRALRPERSASTVPPLRHLYERCLPALARRMWAVEDLNLGPLACEASALTTELTARGPRDGPPGPNHLPRRVPAPRRTRLRGNDRVRTCDLALMKRPLYH